jgi:hypothetical protein
MEYRGVDKERFFFLIFSAFHFGDPSGTGSGVIRPGSGFRGRAHEHATGRVVSVGEPAFL